VSAGGSPQKAGSGNGNGGRRSRFDVRRTPLYWGCRNAFEVRNPAVASERILDWLEFRLRFEDPRDISQQMEGFNWMTRTLAGQSPDGAEIPGATIYFTLAGSTVVLRSLVGDDETDEFFDS
jgi:hypothetical protein